MTKTIDPLILKQNKNIDIEIWDQKRKRVVKDKIRFSLLC